MDAERIQEAMRELQRVKEEVAALHQTQAIAVENVKKAKQAVAQVQQDPGKASIDYSNQKYWNERYKSSVVESADCTLSAYDEAGNVQCYEWYMPFKHLKKYLLEVIKPQHRVLVPGCGNSSLCEDLLAEGVEHVEGCDYSQEAVDAMIKYSAQKRRDQLGISPVYFTADATSMPEVTASSYHAIVDKGTLDAIASGGAGTSGVDSTTPRVAGLEVTRYILELWRVTRMGGYCIIISTMPPDIFYALAVEPLLSCSAKKADALEWKKGCRKLRMQTKESGDVYFYSLYKLNDLDPQKVLVARDTSSYIDAEPKCSSASSRSGGFDKEKESIMAGIKALLEEAKEAKAAFDEAEQERDSAAADLAAAEKQKHALEGQLQTDLYDAADTKDYEEHQNAAADKVVEAALDAAPRISVIVTHPLDGSSAKAGDNIEVKFLLAPSTQTNTSRCGGWDENDSLCIVCDGSGVDESACDEYIYLTEDQPYETFEYATEPVLFSTLSTSDRSMLQQEVDRLAQQSACDISNIWVGSQQLKLPCYACIIHVSYIRTLSLPVMINPASAASAVHAKIKEHTLGNLAVFDEEEAMALQQQQISGIMQRRLRLFRSETFSVRTNVMGGHPDHRYCSSHSAYSAPNSLNLRRRSAKQMSYQLPSSTNNDGENTLLVFVELLRYAKSLLVTFSLPALEKKFRLQQKHLSVNRIQAWLYNDNSIDTASTPATLLNLVVELDAILGPSTTSGVLKKDGNAEQVMTIYTHEAIPISAILPDRSFFDLHDASVEIAPTCDRIICRLPYREELDNKQLVSNDTRSNVSTLLERSISKYFPWRLTPTVSKEMMRVCCRFCGNILVNTMELTGMKPLPSGMLDNMMHEFVCCEEMPLSSNGLSTTELTTPPNLLLFGSNYFSLHPKHIMFNSFEEGNAGGCCMLDCKQQPTILDIFSSCGGAIATKPMPRSDDTHRMDDECRRNRLLAWLAPIINIDTCEVRCQRCSNYVADAQLLSGSSGCIGGVDCLHVQSNRPVQLSQDKSRRSEEQPVFTAADIADVRFVMNNVRWQYGAEQSPLMSVETEQMIARAMLHINEVYSMANFCLHIADCDQYLQNSTSEGAGYITEVIIVRIICKEYAVKSKDSNEIDCLDAQYLKSAVKVTFRCGQLSSLVRGNEARIPLQLHEMHEMRSLLCRRGEILGPSPFKGQQYSFCFI